MISEIESKGRLVFWSLPEDKLSMGTNILQQRAANGLNVESSVVALTPRHATELFSNAVQRLLDIRKWHTLPCSLLTELKLTDHSGLQVDRQIHEDDYFIVKGENGGEEWIKIERVFFQCDPQGPREALTVRARPSLSPLTAEEGPIRPSNTFKVMRHGLNISVTVYGKNDEEANSNSDAETNDDGARPDSTVGAIPGVARVQWRSLVNGILSTWVE